MSAEDNPKNKESADDNPDNPDFPWAWFRAVQDILKEDPPPDVPAPPVAVLPWLYLSPFYCVQGDSKAATLHEELGITHVLSTNRMPPKVLEKLYWELLSHDIQHQYVAADDLLTYDMMAHWKECKEFLQEACDQDTNKKALVHCSAGMNRSGTIAAAAMMHFGNMNLLQVARVLKAKRGYVLSNESFVRQLVLFAAREGHLGDKPEGYRNFKEPQQYYNFHYIRGCDEYPFY